MITITMSDPEGILKALEEAPERVRPAFRQLMERTVAFCRSRIRSRIHGDVLQKKSGRLFGSWLTHVVETSKGFGGIVGTNIVYAAIHEFGGTIHRPEIRPRFKKALAWPIGKSKLGLMGFMPVAYKGLKGKGARSARQVFERAAMMIRRKAGPVTFQMPKRPYVQPSVDDTAVFLEREGPSTLMEAILGQKT